MSSADKAPVISIVGEAQQRGGPGAGWGRCDFQQGGQASLGSVTGARAGGGEEVSSWTYLGEVSGRAWQRHVKGAAGRWAADIAGFTGATSLEALERADSSH